MYSVLPPAGRLHHCYNNWLKITTDSIQILTPMPAPNPEKALTGTAAIGENSRAYRHERKLMQKAAVSVVDAVPNQFVNQICAVPKKDGRPVVKLKPLINTFVEKDHFKMGHMLKEVLRKDDSIDLKDAYLSVPVAVAHRKFSERVDLRPPIRFNPLNAHPEV